MVYIYVLKCQQNKYYVGKTNNPNVRLESHGTAEGSAWTKKYKPIKVLELIKHCDDYDEDKYTKIYMDKYGIENVRGGSFVEMKLDDSTISHLTKMSNGTNDRCFKCGMAGHFARDCSQESEDEEEEEETELDDFKNNFIKRCKKLADKNGNMTPNQILNVLKILTDASDYKLSNIYGICETINGCDVDNGGFLGNDYRTAIAYQSFIDGFIYILKNDPQICEICHQEESICCC